MHSHCAFHSPPAWDVRKAVPEKPIGIPLWEPMVSRSELQIGKQITMVGPWEAKPSNFCHVHSCRWV